MNVYLMFEDREFEMEKELSKWDDLLIEDLEMEKIFEVMSHRDEFLLKVSKVALLSPLKNPSEIAYRQEVLKDCMKNPDFIEEMYKLAVETEEVEKKTFFGFFNKYVTGILDSSVSAMEMLIESLKKLRKMADNSKKFESRGFISFFSRLKAELTENYFEMIEKHLKNLRFENGMSIMAELGKGNKGTCYTLLKPNEEKGKWLRRLFSKRYEKYSFRIAERDEAGAKALMELQEKGLNNVANTLAQCVEHILAFFKTLKAQLAFYISAVNLQKFLTSFGMPISFPQVLNEEERVFECEDLYDPCLVVVKKEKIVANSLSANGKNLFVITGANQGGKTTFLRSVGIAQLMAQSGILVPARKLHVNISSGIFTHFRKEEDKEMESGKFDEELRRFSEIVDELLPNSLLLFNESFAATNEFEGSEIAYQIVKALSESKIKMFFVTHMYEFAHRLQRENVNDVLFLQAERLENGRRTFHIIVAPPQSTSYGQDLLKKIFKL